MRIVKIYGMTQTKQSTSPFLSIPQTTRRQARPWICLLDTVLVLDDVKNTPSTAIGMGLNQ